MSKWKTYAKITDIGAISRRYFVNNFYDGMLTIIGVILGSFVIFLSGKSITSTLIVMPGLSTSITMFISGFSGSFLSEKAEQNKMKSDIQKAMGEFNDNEKYAKNKKVETEEIEKAMLIPIRYNRKITIVKKKKKVKTLHERAEIFAGIIVSLVNGGAPFIGGLVPLIPFFFVLSPNMSIFILSFIVTGLFIILLGIFLGMISKSSIIKYIIQMAGAFIITLLLTTLLLKLLQ
ncbi:MAG: VIT1/CCC1 transporter family protein [Candidatus Lokiarchaeota archaeon]|nr:VIT1/CCC1 transporter family protein [Candidatus Lokiarchaeota archaeon]